MNIIDVNTSQKDTKFPVLNLGFRPFFLAAGLFAVLSVVAWFLSYLVHIKLPLDSINPFQWHAHEMVYGYSMAVIAGFLLTATKNWTGIQTIYGMPLLLVVALWLLARIFFFSGMNWYAGISDLLFAVLLTLAVSIPIIKVKQWNQLAILSKLVALFVFNLLFYLGALGILEEGIRLGLYGGLYLVIGLILMMGRRVVPFFIEKGVDDAVTVHNFKIIDIASLVLFLIFFIAELFFAYQWIAAYSALLLGIVNIFRLIGWYTNSLWKKPLLWSLYLALWSISLGFILYYLSYFFGLSRFIAIHALAYGGIGMMTIGMMARVALGHTARNIHHPPASVVIAFLILFSGVLFRVFAPILLPGHYSLWISIAMACWIIAFSIFTYQYFPILTRKRLDGRFG